MRPEQKSRLLLGVTRSKAKMFEYGVPEEHHITIAQDPAKLFTLSIGLLGDLAAGINREELQPNALADMRKNLLFSAYFFDAYVQSRLDAALDPYLILLGSASYYLCDLPGSAMVLAKHIGDCPDLQGDGLEDLLLWLLQGNLSSYFDGSEGPFGGHIDSISRHSVQFFGDGTGGDSLIDLGRKLRATAYESGTPRQLLFADVIAAVLRKKMQNASWNALPSYSGLPTDKWRHVLQKDSFIKELWPAQHLLGQADVLKGQSAIVQMPTSAGKTKATELVIRSAFLAERTSLAIIVAPFRALCHEIKDSLIAAFHDEAIKVDELSDVVQKDFVTDELLGHQQVLVVTPEKLVYVLRHAPELASNVGLVIFDEGHQFDSGTRGITYELLLTSLRSMLSEGAQKVLISAVISNAEAVGEWLNGTPNVVAGTNLNPTFRSVGFASWLDQLGRIEYVSSEDAEKGEFFVPRVIESFTLRKKPRETKNRTFPEKSDGQAIALYLGLRLASNGSVAIFCGRPSTAASVCKKAVTTIDRGIPLPLPRDFSDRSEIERLHYLHVQNLGPEAPASKSAVHGIFSHHGNTPHGIRLAVEHAMREGLVRFVVCTSTLAQGVNLPIRYLIVTSVYQGLERIKVRDFHNLIGRAGRAGMHTEGSVLFADPIVYDKRKGQYDKWRWEQVKELLEPRNSEPCVSTLLSVFDRIESDDKKFTIVAEALDFTRAYIHDPEEVSRLADEIVREHGDKGFTREGVERQIAWKINLISSIESFLLSHWDKDETALSETDVVRLAAETLAFFLADEQKREHIRELFKLLAQNISANVTDPGRRRVYGRTLYGVRDAQSIEEWVQANYAQLAGANNEVAIIDVAWPLLVSHIHNGVFRKFDSPDILKEVAQEWIAGKPFHNLLETIGRKKARLIWGRGRRSFQIDDVVALCEGGFAYDGSLLIGALSEVVELVDQEGGGELATSLHLLQKRLKYGLPTEAAIALYELGFPDRVVAQDVATTMNVAAEGKRKIAQMVKKRQDRIVSVLEKYPRYFQQRMNDLL